MSGSITFNDRRVLSGTITMPYYGAWTADLILATSDDIAASGKLVVGDLTLHGTVHREAPFGGGKSVRLVGGGNGWHNVLPKKGYSHIVGIRSSSVLSDAARECGEKINVSRDTFLGLNWAREEASAERVLHLLLGEKWWIDTEGVTQINDRETKAVTSPFTVIAWSGSKGRFEIATEKVSDWLPGRTFTAPQVIGTHTIACSTISVDNDGKLRIFVLDGDNTRDRLRQDIRALIRAEIATLTYAGVYEYKVNATSSSFLGVSTLDLVSTSNLVPDLTNVPLGAGMGIVAPPATGTKARVQFVNCDPARPEVIALESTTEHYMTVEATLVLLHNLVIGLGAATLPSAWLVSGVALGLINAAAAATAIPAPPGLIPQTAAAPGIAAAMASGPGNTSLPFAAAVAALSAKTLDVSGLFPGLGVPNG